jgi:hypothetical protein
MAAAIIRLHYKTKAYFAFTLAILLVLTSFTTLLINRAEAVGQLSSASIALSNGIPSANAVGYTIGFKWAASYTVKCVKVSYWTTATGTTEPTGMNTVNAAKGTVTGTGLTNANWSLYSTNEGIPQFENSTGDSVTSGNAAVFPMTNITNPNSAATFYAQIDTYDTLSTHTCSGAKDTITLAWATTNGVTASVTVDPSLSFSVDAVADSESVNSDTTTVTTTSTTIPFGTVAGNTVGIGAHDLTVSTNAAGGYTVYASYSAALTDGASHTIADASGTNGSPATFTNSTTTSAFGYTTESTSLSGSASRFSGTKYAKFTTVGAEIAGNAASPAPVASDTTRVGYKVAISNVQAPGTYTTTVGLVATPTY